MAELFLAVQRSIAGFEKLVVIKRLLPHFAQDRSFIEMLLHEARVAATFSHPNIVQVFDVGEVDGSHFIAMEHVQGADVRSLVHQMKKKGVVEFPLEHAISIVRGMCAGLAYAHEKHGFDGTPLNVVHRDISPQNVVVTFTGDVKIVDFGIAKSRSSLREDPRSRTLKGKAPYMSPEQARGEPVDARSDIFATGVMLFELTTGKRLFRGASESETLARIRAGDYPLPSIVRAGYPPELETIVVRALAKEKTERFQTAREMQAALEKFAEGARLATNSSSLSAFMRSLFEDELRAQEAGISKARQLASLPTHDDRDACGSDHLGSTTGTRRALTIGRMVALATLGLLVAACAGAGAFLWTQHGTADGGAHTSAVHRPNRLVGLNQR
jgi:eukaryotic-like serine/threonine-protein kinase